MMMSFPSRRALGDPTQLCPPDPAAALTTTALAGSGGAKIAGAVSSSCITHLQYATYRSNFAFYEASRRWLASGADHAVGITGPSGHSGHRARTGPRGQSWWASRVRMSLRLRF